MTQDADGVDPFWEQHDLYRVLGVQPNAEHSEMHLAYTRLARAHHADVASGGDERYLRLVNQVWETLGNPERRRAYDAWRAHQSARRAAEARRWEERRRAEAARAAHETQARAAMYLRDGVWTVSFTGPSGSASTLRGTWDQLLTQPGEPYHQHARVPGWYQASGFQVLSEVDGQWLVVDPWSGPTVAYREGRPGPFGGPRGPLYLHISYEPPLPSRGPDVVVTLRYPGEAYWQPIRYRHPVTGQLLQLDARSQSGHHRFEGWGHAGVAGGPAGDLVVTLEYTTPVPSERRLRWRRRRTALWRGVRTAVVVLLVAAVAAIVVAALWR
ncbi:MAG: DnaJ domain-containing protein [Dermatophilaceae bacterium]